MIEWVNIVFVIKTSLVPLMIRTEATKGDKKDVEVVYV